MVKHCSLSLLLHIPINCKWLLSSTLLWLTQTCKVLAYINSVKSVALDFFIFIHLLTARYAYIYYKHMTFIALHYIASSFLAELLYPTLSVHILYELSVNSSPPKRCQFFVSSFFIF